MQTRRVLIVEDDPMVALDLEAIVTAAAGAAEIAVATSVREAQEALRAARFDAAFLDIDVADGRTFDVAQQLYTQGIPFAFVSGARREEVPPPLRQVPFLPKPYDPEEVERALRAGLSARS